MDSSKSDTRVLEGVIQALKDEKMDLWKKLETELEATEREQIEERIDEIDNDLKVYRIGSKEPDSHTDQPLRHSEREKHPTGKKVYAYICQH